MEPYDPTQYMPNLHTTLTAKRHLDLDEFDDSGHVASKRACLQPQNSLAESSLSSTVLQTYTTDLNIDPNFDINFSVEMAKVTEISSFEDQMDTSGDTTLCSTQEDIMPMITASPDIYDTKWTAAIVPKIVDQSEPDTCFGIITTTATFSFEGHKGATHALVILEALETKIKLSSQDTQRYAGIINNATLAKIFREFTIKADAKLATPTNSREKTSKKEVRSFHSPVDCPVRMILYGLATDQYTIGNILGDAGIYFQHPSPSEYDSSMRYCNPHFLLRPGSQMPTLEEDSRTICGRKIESDLSIALNIERLMRLFDEASETTGISRTGIEPSSRLKSKLKEHQISALAWLTEIEAGGIRDGSQTLWESLSGPGPANEYHHKITGNRTANPELAPGGVLADEMGLGKRLSMLALICSSLDAMDTQRDESEETQPGQAWTTLIVTPKSSKLHHALIILSAPAD